MKKKILILIVMVLLFIINVYASNFTMYNKTNESQVYFIISMLGYIGISTANPTNTLTVVGDLKVNGLYVNSTDINVSTGNYIIEKERYSHSFFIDGAGNLIIS